MNNAGIIILTISYILLVGSCNSPTNPPPPASGITIVAPKGGEVFKTTDTVKIIRTCNYNDFVSGTNTDCSLDSQKSWDPVMAVVRKNGIITDTIKWFPADVYPDSSLINRGIMIRVQDYNKAIIAKSGYFFFTMQ
jgi:hypothetical protein